MQESYGRKPPGKEFEPEYRKSLQASVMRLSSENLDEDRSGDDRPRLWDRRYKVPEAAFLISTEAFRAPATKSPASLLMLTRRIPRAAHAEVIATSLV